MTILKSIMKLFIQVIQLEDMTKVLKNNKILSIMVFKKKLESIKNLLQNSILTNHFPGRFLTTDSF